MSFNLPDPPDDIRVRTITLPAGQVLHRVHNVAYAPDQFNPSGTGSARFSPISDENGDPVPALYAASTLEGALMETVFHDVATMAMPRMKPYSHFAGMVHSTVVLNNNLTLIDLTNKSLIGVGVRRQDLIESEAEHYAATRAWAKAIHEQNPEIHGLYWISRQDDTAQAMMLFGDRIPAGGVTALATSRGLLSDAETENVVLHVADIIGAMLVPD